MTILSCNLLLYLFLRLHINLPLQVASHSLVFLGAPMRVPSAMRCAYLIIFTIIILSLSTYPAEAFSPGAPSFSVVNAVALRCPPQAPLRLISSSQENLLMLILYILFLKKGGEMEERLRDGGVKGISPLRRGLCRLCFALLGRG